jgi:hypothetical protein
MVFEGKTYVDGFCLVVDCGLEVVGLVAVYKFGLDSHAREHDFELVVGASIEIRCRDDVIACVG